ELDGAPRRARAHAQLARRGAGSGAHAPGAEQHDGGAGAARQRELAERAPAAADAEHDVGAAHDEAVAQLAEAGRERDGEEAVAGGAIAAREQPDGDPAGAARALADRLHDPAEAAAEDDGAGSREPLA